MKKIDVDELKELFIEIKYNNNIAFEKLYKRYNKLVYGIGRKVIINYTDYIKETYPAQIDTNQNV